MLYHSHCNHSQTNVSIPSSINLHPIDSLRRSVRHMHSENYTTASYRKKRNNNNNNHYSKNHQNQIHHQQSGPVHIDLSLSHSDNYRAITQHDLDITDAAKRYAPTGFPFPPLFI